MNDVIHAAANIELSAYTYTEVYAQVSASPTINGTAITIPAGQKIQILVKSLSATADVFAIGHKTLIPPTIING